MPTYVYRCKKCKHRFEVFHSITDEAPRRCPRCKGKAERVPSGGGGILFKGTGFYITDYRSKSYRDKAKSEKSGGSEGGSSGGGGKDSGGGGKPSGGGGKDSGGGGGKQSGGGGSKAGSGGGSGPR
jgi:putative FmdB family regulatory protein